MRLIDADGLDYTVPENPHYLTSVLVQVLKNAIDKCPTVDAVPVVRCKDCVRWDDAPDTYGTDDGPKGKCMKSFETMCADDFCSYSERKDGGDG